MLIRKRKAFISIEILGVATACAIAFAVFLPHMGFSSNKTKICGVKADLCNYKTAVSLVTIENGCLGSVIDSGATKQERSQVLANALNEKLNDDLKLFVDSSGSFYTKAVDPWGNPYQANYIEESESFCLISSGEDGLPDIIYDRVPNRLEIKNDFVLIGQNANVYAYWEPEPCRLKKEPSSETGSSPGKDPSSEIETIPGENLPTGIVKQWDISEDAKQHVSAAIYNDSENPGYYLLKISGTGKMKDWGKSENAVFHAPQYWNFISRVEIESGVTNISKYFLYQNTSVYSVILPNTITKIEKYAFYNCSNLSILCDAASEKTVNTAIIPGSVQKINEKAFGKCSNFHELIISEGVKEIEEDAFKNCFSLKRIFLPNSIQEIDEDAFSDCGSLVQIVIDKKKGSVDDDPWGADSAAIQWSSK